MSDLVQKILNGRLIDNWCGYILAILLASLIIRMFMTGLTAWISFWKNRRGFEADGFWATYWRRFCGVYARPAENPPDYWIVFLLGFLELLAFPVLMAAGAWVAIGAWLTLKTVAQWDVWKASRNTFNVFLIGNATVLMVAYGLARYFVTITKDWASYSIHQ